MSGRKKAAITIAIIVFAAALSAVFLWGALPPYIRYLMPSGNLATPQDGIPPAVPRNDTGNATKPGTSERFVIQILSTPSAFALLDKWVARYNLEDSLASPQIDWSDEADDIRHPRYSNVTEFLADRSADLVITGSVPMQQIPLDNGSAFLPVSPQAVAVVYNIPGFPDVPSGLRLDPQTLSAILSGNITFWDDSRITGLNPNLTLPHEAITVVHEASEGSASELLDRYLSAFNSTVKWQDASLTADYPDDISALVRRTPNSVGYVEFSWAMQTRMTYAALQNSDGEFVSPSYDSIGNAILNGTVADLPTSGNDTSFLSDNPSSITIPSTAIGLLGNGSYPIVGFYYAAFQNVSESANGNATIVGTDAEVNNRSAAISDFVSWIVSEQGQAILRDTQYPPVYELNERLRSYLDEILD
jgi:phosphate transport system substrate-binding protein